MRHVVLAASAIAFYAAEPAFAQTQALTRDIYNEQASQAPLDRSASPLAGLEVVTGQDTTTAAIRGNYQFSHNNNFSALSFTLSSPVDKGGGATTLANLDGLANSTSFELGFNEMRGRALANNDAEIGRLCDVARVNAGQAASGNGCSYRDMLQHAPGEYGAWLQATRGYDYVWLWGASARVGFQDFNYFDATTLARQTNDETLWRASAYVGYIMPSNAMATLTLTAQTAFKDQRTQVLCPVGAPPVTCVNGPIGAPEEVESLLISAEYRRELYLGNRATRFESGPDVGYSFAATYDLETEVYGFDLPIYLLRDANDLLTGGIRLGWRSDEHELTVGLIISRPFSFTNTN